MEDKKKTAIIIGAGPAGLTAGYELLERTDIKPIIFEMTGDIGGISKTVNYKGNRIDIGGHRFFSKSDRVIQFWLNIMPLQRRPAKDDIKLGRVLPAVENTPFEFHGQRERGSESEEADPEKTDLVALLRDRTSRIFFNRNFFDYPVTLGFKTIKNLGLMRIAGIGFSYIKARLFPIKNEKTLEELFINRFGRELYGTFFRDYTEKVWGVPCSEIPAQWGAQRIKGLSITGAVVQAIRNVLLPNNSVDQKGVETTLITRFMYPKFGPGQLWERVAEIIESKGGQINLNSRVSKLICEGQRIASVVVEDANTGESKEFKADYVFSSMPVKELIGGIVDSVPDEVREVSEGLVYRDFITVGLLLNKLKIKNQTKVKTVNDIVPDNWIYIQEPDVKIGRLQIFNNWSPYMVKDEDKVWIGLEYFCNEGDELWGKADDDFIDFAVAELAKIDIIDASDVLDSVLIRMPKTYPAYFGSYGRFEVIRQYADRFENLFLVGRNGMHKYNNQDHSMLTAMTAVDNIVNGVDTKDNIWAVNTEQEYHEEK